MQFSRPLQKVVDTLLRHAPDKARTVSERMQAEEDGTAVPGEAVMEGVEHLGQFIFEMTTTKIKQLGAEHGFSETAEQTLKPITEEDEVGYVSASDEADEDVVPSDGVAPGEA